MAGRHAKTVDLIDNKKQRLTKEQIDTRRAWEKQLASDSGMTMSGDVRSDPYARALFNRMKKIFAEVSMDDAFYGEGLNTYCLIKSEIRSRAKERVRILQECTEDMATVYALANSMDKTIAKLRDQAFAWEKENLCTVQAKLRVIPKKPQNDDGDNVTGIEAFMRRQG